MPTTICPDCGLDVRADNKGFPQTDGKVGLMFWKRKKTHGPSHVVSEENQRLARTLPVTERKLFLTDDFLDSFPTDEEILTHFTKGFRFIIEAKVIRQSEWVDAPADNIRAMVIVRGVRDE